jgi:hypothetical protein
MIHDLSIRSFLKKCRALAPRGTPDCIPALWAACSKVRAFFFSETRLERLFKDKRSSSFVRSINFKEKKFYNIDTRKTAVGARSKGSMVARELMA